MNLEDFCGLREYGTSSEGTGGQVKKKPEDFRVEEIPREVGKGDGFLICEMKKKGLTTFQAISKVASALNISRKRMSYAGLKDRRALTTQRISIKGVEKEKIQGLDVGNIDLTPVQTSSKPVKPGQLSGNRFKITIRNIGLSRKDCKKRLGKLRKEIGKKGVPNYFGLQRFGGRRPVTHLVGRKLLKKEFREAVMTYLVKTFPTERGEFREAREKLSRDEDFSEVLDYFPKQLDYERKLIEAISRKKPEREREWLKLIKIFPKGLRRLFVHAYQSYLFNVSLSNLLENRENVKNFPAKIVGYSTKPSSSAFDEETKRILKEDGIKPEDFRFKEMSELSSEGAIRASLIETQVGIEGVGEDDINPGKTKATIKFSLKPGRYATVVLREITK